MFDTLPWRGLGNGRSGQTFPSCLPRLVTEENMVLNERSRDRLFQRLKSVLGDDDATTLMEYLPPVGWADFATKHDVDALGVATHRDLEAHRVATQGDLAGLRVATQRDLEAHRVATQGDLAGLRVATQRNLEAHRVATQRDLEAHR